MATTAQTKPKKIYLEILRCLAILLVIFNHTGDAGFIYYTTLEPGFKYYLFMACSVLTVMNIPIFYMISGATLMHKDEPIGVVWKKRILRYALVIVIFSFLQYLLAIQFDPHSFSISTFFKAVFSRDMIVPYWFLYEYLGFLIMVPIFRKLFRALSREDMLYIVCIYLAFSSALPIIEYLANGWHLMLNEKFDVTAISNDLVLYPMLGYFLSSEDIYKDRKQSKRIIAVMWALSFACLAFTMITTDILIPELFVAKEGWVGTFYKSLICIPTATVFITARWLFENRELPVALNRIILSFSSCVFGTYLIEQIIREHTWGLYFRMAAHMPNFVAVVLFVFAIALICWPIVWCLKKIPGLKKLI